jgi:GT2 family glycosyltransferase
MKLTIIIPLASGKEIEGLEQIKKQKIKCIPIYGKNPSKNRNQGVKSAKTDYVAFINGHSIISDNWLKKAESFFKEHPEIDIVGGPQLTPESDNLFEQASGYALSSKFGSANVNSRYKLNKMNLNADETMLTSANLICKKRVFKKIKFDESVYPGEDPKFIEDARKKGFKVAYSPEIIVYNKRRADMTSFIKQIFSYGFTRPKKESFMDTLKKPFFLVPSLFLIYFLFLPMLFLVNKALMWPILAYFILSILCSLYESIKNKNFRSFFILPLLFLIIHMSYGLGFIFGTVNKFKYKGNR